MRRHLPVSEGFHIKSQETRERVKQEIESLAGRANTYLKTMIGPAICRMFPKNKLALTAEDKAIIQDFQRNCLGAVGKLVSDAIDGIISSKYIMPEDQWVLIMQVCHAWQETIVPLIQRDPIFRGEIYELSGSHSSRLATMVQQSAYGLVSVFALTQKAIVMKYTDLGQIDEMHDADKHILKGCFQLYLEIIYQSERLIKHAEASRFPVSDRQKIWTVLRKLDPANEALIWFEKTGEVTLYPEWWEASASLSDRWSRYVSLEYSRDYNAFYVSQDEKLSRDFLAINEMEDISLFDTFDYLQLMKCLKACMAKLIADVEKSCHQNSVLALQLRGLAQKAIMQFYLVFNEENDFYEAGDQREAADSLYRDLSKAIGMVDRAGRVAWPDSFYTARISIADVWKKYFTVLGFKTYEEFIASNTRLVVRHVTWEMFEKRWEMLYAVGGKELADDEKHTLEKDLKACVDAISIRLDVCDVLSDEIRQDYRRILETYVSRYKDNDIVRLLERTTQYLRESLVSKIWQRELCKHTHSISFYRQQAIIDFIHERNYRFQDHAIKAMMAEGSVELLKAHNAGLIELKDNERIRFYNVLQLFLTTHFSKDPLVGIEVQSLKQSVYTLLDCTVFGVVPREDRWLTQARQCLARRYYDSIYVFSEDKLSNAQLTISGYQQLSMAGKRLLAHVILYRLEIYCQDVEQQRLAIRYVDDNRQAWLKIAFRYIQEHRFLSDEDDVLYESLRQIIKKLDSLGEHGVKKPGSIRMSHMSAQKGTYEHRILLWKNSEIYLNVFITNSVRFKEVPIPELAKHLKQVYLSSHDPELISLRDDWLDSDELCQKLIDNAGLGQQLVHGWLVEAMQESVMLRSFMTDDLLALFRDESMFEHFLKMSDYMSSLHLSKSSFYMAYLLFWVISPATEEISSATLCVLVIFRQFIYQRHDVMDGLLDVAFSFPGFYAYFNALGHENIATQVNTLMQALHEQLSLPDVSFDTYQNNVIDFGINFKAMGLEGGAKALFAECSDESKAADYALSLLSVMGLSNKLGIKEEWDRLARGDWRCMTLFNASNSRHTAAKVAPQNIQSGDDARICSAY